MKLGWDNEPFDYDGSIEIYNATILAGGTRGMEYLHSGIDKINQNYIYGGNIYVNSDGDGF